MRLTIGVKGILLVAVPLVFELLFVGLLSYLLHQSEAETQRQLRSKTIVAQANMLMRRAASVTMSAGAYTFTRDPAFSDEYEKILVQIDLDIDEMSKFATPQQRKHLKQMKVIMDALERRLQAYKEAIRNSDANDLFAVLGNTKGLQVSRQLIGRLGIEMDEFLKYEKLIERESPETLAANKRNIQLALWGGVAVSILVAVSLARFFSSSISSRVNQMTDNTMRLARGESLAPPMKGNDELSHLDTVFHQVVAHLNEVSQAKQELVAVVSHELRTPLTSFSGLLSLLQAGALGTLTERGASRIAGAEADLLRVIRLINDLLDVEKLEAGKLEMYIREIPVYKVLERALLSVQGISELRKINIEIEKSDEHVYADEDRLVQVLVNFLSNAIKYSNDEGTIRVSVHESAEQVEVRVSDNGRGIPPEYQKSVFERYTQVEREDSTVKGGTGLGLHVCKKIVEQLGGSIGVDSQVGKGSTFWFRIRRAVPATT
ncbi:MAG: HAMP domain-containing histidine kinase [Candidatus Obscuribacterales bacterium]|nr:HAMP domain-containing histidine kinase [Candidatus Obscuribacterales bacterium]